MHLLAINIENIRSIRSLRWQVPAAKSSGWHVVLGDNGSGKSTFLKSIALALVGASNAAALRQPWSDWLSRDKDSGSIQLEIGQSKLDDKFVSRGPTPTTAKGLPVEIRFNRSKGDETDHVELSSSKASPDPTRHVWGEGSGWFCASYGPFRRFSGGDASSEKMFYSMPRLARHLSLFDERVALTECLEWLKSLKFKQLEKDSEGALLTKVQEFLNGSELLPAGVALLEVTSKSVLFNDANGATLPAEDLSDGYRSVLSMTFELIRQLAATFGAEGVFSADDPTIVQPSGVVVIDEVDAHLHPTWQKRIGDWFCKHFPNIQFIVSTHSPLVCQSAGTGSIFVLPKAGDAGEPRFVTGDAFNRLVFGNVLEAYGTDAFGGEAALTRSNESNDLRRRLAELNNKEFLKGLSAAEQAERHQLRAFFPIAASDLQVADVEGTE